MRTFMAAVSGAVALLALLATVPLLWVSTHVADQQGYVRFSSSLAADSELQGAFAAYLSDELVARGVLPKSVQVLATTALTRVAGRAANAPGFVEAWEETQLRFHRSAFADPTPQVLAVDVGPMATFVTKRVTTKLPVRLTVPDDLVVPVVSDAKDRAAVAQIKKTRWLGWTGGVIVIGAAVAAVGFARRKSVAASWLGLGTAAVAGVLWIATGPLSQRVLDHTAAPSEFARTVQKLLVDRAADSLGAWLVVLAIGGGAVAVAGLVGRVVTAFAGSSD